MADDIAMILENGKDERYDGHVKGREAGAAEGKSERGGRIC